MTPPPAPSPSPPADALPVREPDATRPETDETADLFRWMSWSAAIAMNA